MYQPIVQLKSGGYLVINPTEALVSIDINSGRSTREHNIEQTAYNTNLEAAQEIARQLRLRDMAGLIVIDFIDMEQNSHVRKVEKAMKEALKNDRARIQVGRISSFGLMEMSRQRLRTGVLEASTKPCPHCEGTGLMRTAASAGLSALRMLEDEAARGRGERICLRAGKEAAIYVLNKKRSELADIEQRYAVNIEVLVDESFEGARMTVDSSGPRPVAVPRPEAAAVEEQEEFAEEQFEEEEGEEEESEALETASEGERTGRRRRRRRRGGRGRRREGGEPAETSVTEPHQAGPETAFEEVEGASAEVSTEEPRQSSRRRRRRRGRGGGAELAEVQSGDTLETTVEGSREPPIEADSSPMVERPIDEEPPIAEVGPAEEPQPARRGRRKKAVAEPAAPQAEVPEAPSSDEPGGEKKPGRKRRSKKAEGTSSEPSASVEPIPLPAANNDLAEDGSGEPRRGWWQRTFG